MNTPIFILFADDEKIIFQVPSTSDPNDSYMVTWDFDNGWLCDCDGCLKGGHLCKHIITCIRYVKFMQMAILDDPRAVFTAVEGVV